MVTDRLRKAWSIIKHKGFVEIIRTEDQKELLAFIQTEDNFKEAFQQRGANLSKVFEFGTNIS